jgi:branched-chain amino acid transport system permease protein
LTRALTPFWVLLAGVAVFAVLPAVLEENNLFLLTDLMVAALFAMSFNLLLGQAGLLSFGHAAFYGVGAYTVALLQARLGWPVALGVALAPLCGGLVAIVIGTLTLHLSGMYFAMLTLAFSQLIFAVVSNWYSLTGGDNGLPIDLPETLLQIAHLYYLCLGIVGTSILLLLLLAGSPFGAALASIRENPQRAAFIGLNTRRYQLAAFAFSGALSGLAGALRALEQQMAFPSLLFWVQSADPVLMALAGGVRSFFGPVVGAALFVFLNFVVSTYADYPLFVFGVVVLLVVLFLPDGIVGTLARLWPRWRHSVRGDAPRAALVAERRTEAP